MPFPWMALATFGGSALSSLLSGNAAAENNATQIKLAREQMGWNAQQATLNRNWQERMINEQNDFNWRMYNDNWRRETAYNSPTAQMARLQAAGINPYVAAGDVANVGNVSMSSPTAAPAPSGSTAAPVGIPHTDPINYLGGLPVMAQQLASALVQIGQAKKVGVDTKLAESTLDDMIEQVRENLKGTKFENAFKSVRNDIQSKYADPIARATYEKIAGEVMLNLAKEDESKWNSSYISQKINESIANQHLAEAQKKSVEDQLPWLVQKIQEETNTIRKQGDAAMINARANEASSLAQAAEAYGRLKTENERREWLVENSKYLAFKARDEWKVFAQTMQEQFGMKFWQLELIKQQITNLNDANTRSERWETLDHVSDMIRSFSSLKGK